MSEHDVRGEERGVRESERDADGLHLELDVRQEVDADHAERQRGAVPRRPRPHGGERDDGKELDRRDRAERQRVDGDVEAGVHHSEHDPECQHQSPRRAIHSREHAPRAAPEREHGCRAGDAKPCDAERLRPGEQQHREGGPEVVEDGAADEVGLGRSAFRQTRASHAAILGAGMA